MRKKAKLFLQFSSLLLPYRGRWLLVLLLSVLTALLSLVNPYLSKLMIDRAIENKDLPLFFFLALLGGGVFVLDTLFESLRRFLENYIKMRVGFDLNRKVYKKIQTFPLAWFKDRSTGEHLYRIGYDLDRVTSFVSSDPPQALSLFPRVILTLVILFSLNVPMAVFALCLAPFLYVPSVYLSQKMREIWEAFIGNSEGVFKDLEEIFSHIYLVKAFGKESSSVRSHLRRLIANARLHVKKFRLEAVTRFVSQLLSRVIAGLIAFYGIYQVIKGGMTFGTFTAIMVYLSQLMGLQYQFANFYQTAVLGLVSCERVSQILDQEMGKERVVGSEAVAFDRPAIVFDKVSFCYGSGEYIFRELDFKIEHGKHIALIGPSGCGKTTLLNLILRLYAPSGGSISLGGHPLADLTNGSLLGQIGVALQEPFLWNDTIQNNIQYGKEDATKDEILRVAELTGVDEIVKRLPAGYGTVIGENACKLSEGQKQRIAIARALIKNPKILILDEAMSSMDSESEEKILAAIKKTNNDMTILTVSHRLSTVMHAERAYYLKNGDRMVVDTPQNLLRQDLDFPRLFLGQESINPQSSIA